MCFLGNESSSQQGPPAPAVPPVSRSVATITSLRGTTENIEKRKLHLQKKVSFISIYTLALSFPVKIENEMNQARAKIKAGKKKDAVVPLLLPIQQS